MNKTEKSEYYTCQAWSAAQLESSVQQRADDQRA